MKYVSGIVMLFVACCFFSVSVSAQETAAEYYRRGTEIIKKGWYREAIHFFDEALKLDSNYVDALLARSRAKSNNQYDLKGAMADLETILQINPQFGEAFYERARIRDAMITEMVGKKGSMRAEEVLPFYKNVLEDLNAAILNGYQNERSYGYRAALHSRHLDNQAEAVKDYTEALKHDPDDPHILLSRSRAKRLSGDLDGSIDDLREVVRMYELNDSSQTAAEKRQTLKSAAVMALNNLSTTYALGERPDLQVWALEKSIAIEPSFSAYAALARHKVIHGDLDEAVADYSRAIEMSQNRVGAYFMDRGIVYLLQDKKPEAEADFARGRKIDPILEKTYGVCYSLELARRQREQRKVRVELPRCGESKN